MRRHQRRGQPRRAGLRHPPHPPHQQQRQKGEGQEVDDVVDGAAVDLRRRFLDPPPSRERAIHRVHERRRRKEDEHAARVRVRRADLRRGQERQHHAGSREQVHGVAPHALPRGQRGAGGTGGLHHSRPGMSSPVAAASACFSSFSSASSRSLCVRHGLRLLPRGVGLVAQLHQHGIVVRPDLGQPLQRHQAKVVRVEHVVQRVAQERVVGVVAVVEAAPPPRVQQRRQPGEQLAGGRPRHVVQVAGHHRGLVGRLLDELAHQHQLRVAGRAVLVADGLRRARVDAAQ